MEGIIYPLLRSYGSAKVSNYLATNFYILISKLFIGSDNKFQILFYLIVPDYGESYHLEFIC